MEIIFLSIFMIEFIVKSMTEECSGNWSLSSDSSRCVFLFPKTSTTELVNPPFGPSNKSVFNGFEAEDLCYIAGGYLMHSLELPEAEVLLRSQNITKNLTLIMRLQPYKGRVPLFPVLDDSGNILEQPYMARSEFKCACSEWNVTIVAPDLMGDSLFRLPDTFQNYSMLMSRAAGYNVSQTKTKTPPTTTTTATTTTTTSPWSNTRGQLSVPVPCSCQTRGQVVCLRALVGPLLAQQRCEKPLPLQSFNNALSTSRIPKYFNSTSRKPYPSEFSLDYANAQIMKFIRLDLRDIPIRKKRAVAPGYGALVNQYEVELPDYWKLSSLMISKRFSDEQNFRIHFLERNMSWKSYFVKDSLNDTIPYVPKWSAKVGQTYEIRLSKPVVGNYFIIEDWPTNFPATIRSDGGFGIKLFGCPMNLPYEYTKTKFVGGQMEGNRVWSPSNGVIVVNNSLTIAPSDTLTIQPGVHVYLTQWSTFYINGNLTIDGTESNPIELSSLWPTANRVYTGNSQFYPWDSLLVGNTGYLKISNAILQHVITGIDNTMQTGVQKGRVVIGSNVKVYNSRTAVRLSEQQFNISFTNTLINRADNGLEMNSVGTDLYFFKMAIQNAHFGIAIYGNNNNNWKVVIQKSLFSFCDKAILMSAPSDKFSVDVSDSSFIENIDGLEIVNDLVSLRLVNNSWINNKVHHVAMLLGDITIINNTFNGKGLVSLPLEYKIIGNNIYNTDIWYFDSVKHGLISGNLFFNTTLMIQIEPQFYSSNLSILENYFEDSENSAVIISTSRCNDFCNPTVIHLVNIKKNRFIYTATDSYGIAFLNPYTPDRMGKINSLQLKPKYDFCNTETTFICGILKINITDNTFHKIGQLRKPQMVPLQSQNQHFLKPASAIYGAFHVHEISIQLNVGFNKFTHGIGQVMAVHWNETGTLPQNGSEQPVALGNLREISVLKNEITDWSTDWSIPPDSYNNYDNNNYNNYDYDQNYDQNYDNGDDNEDNYDNFIHSLISVDLAPIDLLSNPISQTGPVYEVNISENVFKDCQASAAVYFKSPIRMPLSDNQTCNKISKNTLQLNNFTSTILLNAIDMTLEENFFSNAPATTHELRVIYSNRLPNGTMLQNTTINATYNWWGSSNETEIQSKILDGVSDPRYVNVSFKPFLFLETLSCVSNCNGKGVCIMPNRCQCIDGFTGDSCQHFKCENNCNNHGSCTGPNQCDCNEGWDGKQCMVPVCETCFNNGICTSPHRCTCFKGYKTATNCSTCEDGFFVGKDNFCHECPSCTHGTCNNFTGMCMCENSKWAGPLCSDCSEGHIGTDCLAEPYITNALPMLGPDDGGTRVIIYGYNLDSNIKYNCTFGSLRVEATIFSPERLECWSPRMSNGSVNFIVEGAYMANQHIFQFFRSCVSPRRAKRDTFSASNSVELNCGALSNPVAGYCSNKKCFCLHAGLGPNCSDKILAPEISFLQQSPLQIQQFAEAKFGFNVKGTLPICAQIVPVDVDNSPVGVILDRSTRTVTYFTDTMIKTLMKIKLEVTNPSGTSTGIFDIEISSGYHPFITALVPPFTLYKSSGLIQGRIDGVTGYEQEVPVILRAMNEKTQKISPYNLFVNSITREFQMDFTPSNFTAGRILMDVVHPFRIKENFQTMFTWDLAKLQLSRNLVVINRTFSELSVNQVINVAELENPVSGILAVNDIEIVQLYSSANSAPKNKDPVILALTNNESPGEPWNKINLGPGEKRPLFFHISNVSYPMETKIKLIYQFKSREGTNSIPLIVDLQISKEPLEHQIRTNPTNMGLINAAQRRYKRSLTGHHQTLGTVTVHVQDEYTFVGPDYAPVALASVSLWISMSESHFKATKLTGASGNVTFTKILPGFYNLHVTALQHSELLKPVKINQETTKISVFLPRIKMKSIYSFIKNYLETSPKLLYSSESLPSADLKIPVISIIPKVIYLPHSVEGSETSFDLKLTNLGNVPAFFLSFSMQQNHVLGFDFQLPANITYLANGESTSVHIRVTKDILTNETEIARQSGCMLSLYVMYENLYLGELQSTSSIETKVVLGDMHQHSEICSSNITEEKLFNFLASGDYESKINLQTALYCDCNMALLECLLQIYPEYSYPKVTNLSLLRGRANESLKCFKCSVQDTKNGLLTNFTVAAQVRAAVERAAGLLFPDEFQLDDFQWFRQFMMTSQTGDLTDVQSFAQHTVRVFIDMLPGDQWKKSLWQSMADDSRYSTIISHSEEKEILHEAKAETQGTLNDTLLSYFLKSWSQARMNWANGEMYTVQITPDIPYMISYKEINNARKTILMGYQQALEEGYSNVIDWYYDLSWKAQNYTSSMARDMPPCATGSVSVETSFVEVGDAFSLTISLENLSNRPFTGISIEPTILQKINNTMSSTLSFFDVELQSFGNEAQETLGAKLNGISSIVDGHLSSNSNASAIWKFIPKIDSVLADSQMYYIGASISFNYGGTEFTQDLHPRIIQVHAMPMLDNAPRCPKFSFFLLLSMYILSL